MRLLYLLAVLSVGLHSCADRPEPMEDLTARVFSLAESQYAYLADQLDESRFPRSLNPDGTLSTSDIDWWCSGFFAGSLWYIYEYGRSDSTKALADRFTLALEPLVDRPVDHDIGFQIESSFGNALRLTSDSTRYESVIVDAAVKLAERFNPVAGVTRSWDKKKKYDWEFPVIIDNMMNLELLMNAARLSGNVELRNVARTHAYTTMKNHFRPDYSTWHLVDYSIEDGSVRRKQTHQGFSDDSMWARGEAWALYGYTMMAEWDGNDDFLEQARHIADLLLERLPEDGIPYWDFDCPGDLRDASAAAIMASAFTRLHTLTKDVRYRDMAEKQLRKLASPEYLAEKGGLHGFLLKHCVGNYPKKSEVDVPLSYADYYFLEALLRFNPQAD